MLRGDDIVTGIEKTVPDQFDDFIGTIADHDIVPVHPELFRDRRAQLVTAAVGIDVDPLGRDLHRLDRLRRRTEWILIRGELDDVGGIEPQLAGRLLDWFPRIINHQTFKPRMRFFNNG